MWTHSYQAGKDEDSFTKQLVNIVSEPKKERYMLPIFSF